MSKTESIAVGLAVGILCPLLLFVLCWWSTAALSIWHILPVPVSVIVAAAFAGLVGGVVLDALYLRRWVARFYYADMRLMVLVYLFCSAIAVAMFMGLPLGNIILGTLAGGYVGRRRHFAGESETMFPQSAKKLSLFIALITGLEALPIGLLALGEDWVAESLGQILGLEATIITGVFGVGLVVLLCAILMVIQFWCACSAARFTYRHGSED